MNAVDVTFYLPEELIEEAKAAGLLSAERIAGWLKAELERRRHIEELRRDIRRLHALEPASTSEIKAVREEQLTNLSLFGM